MSNAHLPMMLIPVVLLFPAFGVVVLLYLKSFNELLQMVQQDKVLWLELGKPERIVINQPNSTIHTISPLTPMLHWVWAGDTQGTSRAIARKLRETSRLFKFALMLFALAIAAFLGLVLPELGTP